METCSVCGGKKVYTRFVGDKSEVGCIYFCEARRRHD